MRSAALVILIFGLAFVVWPVIGELLLTTLGLLTPLWPFVVIAFLLGVVRALFGV